MLLPQKSVVAHGDSRVLRSIPSALPLLEDIVAGCVPLSPLTRVWLNGESKPSLHAHLPRGSGERDRWVPSVGKVGKAQAHILAPACCGTLEN